MKKQISLSFLSFIFCLTGFISVSYANNIAYQQRQQAYIDSCLSPNGTGNKLILQAYRNLPLDTVALNAKLALIPIKSTIDFDIIELVRILFFSNGQYDAKILPALNSIPYWVNYGDTLRGYWSENHMIMWMSSDWLLHEKYNRPIDNNLRNRLVHYLNLKIQYGYYEFFSTTYAPFSLSGLVNLADFAQDVEIKSLATQAAQRVLKDLLLLTNDKGVIFPVAGRNYPEKYTKAYGLNHNKLIYLLTGFGQMPKDASASGSFLATSTLPVDDVIQTWTPEVDMVYSIGHTLQDGFALNSNMSAVDKIIFQWSSGAYFHPEVVLETVNLLVDSNMWEHVDFELLEPLSGLPVESFPGLSENLSYISKSTLICGQEIAIFKNHAVTLSSVLDFWKGKVGFQQYPCVANVGTTSVFTASGEVDTNWNANNRNNQNIHLPYVAQQKNVSLIMYRPEETSSILGPAFAFKDVALYFDDADYDEIFENDLWLLGRQENSYVAVRRNCLGEINGVRACPTTNGQTWVIVVGDSLMYGSFSNFKNAIQQANYTESWYVDSVTNTLVYYAKIEVDTISIEYTWGLETQTGLNNNAAANNLLSIYPNPATNNVKIEIQNSKLKIQNIKIVDVVGSELFNIKMNEAVNEKVLALDDYINSAGIYFIEVTLDNNEKVLKKIVKK